MAIFFAIDSKILLQMLLQIYFCKFTFAIYKYVCKLQCGFKATLKKPSAQTSHSIGWKMEKCCWQWEIIWSKTFDCLLGESILAKLIANDVSLFALRVIYSHLYKRQHKI